MTNEGLKLGHSMAELAAGNAGAAWKDSAYSAFIDYAKTHSTFTTEDVRLANPDLPAPRDARAWGAIPRKAVADNIVTPAGWTRAKSLTVHGMVVTKWESNICD